MRLWYAAVWLALVLATPPAFALLLLAALTGRDELVEPYLVVVIARAYYGGLAFPDPEP